MDRYRSLYKENSAMLTPSQHSRVNRELQNANRAKSRREIFESGRNIDVSPTPRKIPKSKEHKNTNLESEPSQKSDHGKENTDGDKNCAEPKAPTIDCNKSRIALVATSKAKAKSATNQEAFLLRFIEWKQAHKRKQEKQNEMKKRPFVPSGGVGGKTFGNNNKRAPSVSSNIKNKDVASFVPKDHKKFKPPAGLETTMSKMTSVARDVFANDRKSLYTIVPTPPKNKQELKETTTALSKTPAVSNLTRTNPYITPAVGALKTKSTTANKLASTNFSSTKNFTTKPDSTIPRTTSKPTAVIAPNNNTIGRALTYPTSTAATTSTAACGIQNTVKKIDTKLVIRQPMKNNTCNINKNGINDNKENKNRLNFAHKFKQPQVPKATTTLARKPVPRTKVIGSTNTIANTKHKQNPPTTGTTTGAIGKAHVLQSKKAAIPNQPQQRNAKFATSFKAKKTQISKFNRPNAPSKITIKGKTLLGTCKTDAAFAIAETPTDLLNINPYEPLVTSTRIKSLSPHTTIAPNLSPINKEVDIATTANNVVAQDNLKNNNNIRTHHSSASAKRTLLQNEVKPKAGVQAKQPKQILNQKSKFNFVRYSVGLSELDTTAEVTINNGHNEEAEEENEVDGTKQQLTVLEVQTQVKVNLPMPPESGTNFASSAPQEIGNTNGAERPVNYVGSFVSVSRGKVSARKEREKRDSIYVPSADNTLIATTPTPNTPIKTSTQKAEIECESTVATATTPISIEARRMLEAVRYFRQQLHNEIERLHAMCDEWDEYKQAHLQHLQQTGGEDMINVTIGQTKLLTSKKFQQFRGLIDRCESGARGTAAANDGSEDTKPISDVDLEGFWSMLNLQVDNIEKRFENLTRWKANNWSDPEDLQQQNNKQVKQKAKPNLTKVNKKTKAPVKAAKASSGLQAMLRKMHADMRKNKQAGTACTNTDVALILTPTKGQRQRRSHSGTPKIECINGGGEQRNSTPRRVSVVVRDRKSLSAAATVISLPADSAVVSAVAAQRRLTRTLAAGCESPKSLKVCSNELRRSLSNMEKAFGDCNDLLRTALTSNAQQKARRRSGTPNFIESPLDTYVKQDQQVISLPTSPPPPPTPVAASRKSILKTPGTAKGKPKNVIFNEKCRVKKFKFTLEDDRLSDDEELQMQTSTEEPLEDGQQRTYSLRTRKVVLRPSSEFEIPKA